MIKIYSFGVLAQLGARRTGSAKVTGSSPVYSIFIARMKKEAEGSRECNLQPLF